MQLSPLLLKNYNTESTIVEDQKLDLDKGYFFTGPAGIGKTFLSLQFVKAWETKLRSDFKQSRIQDAKDLDPVDAYALIHQEPQYSIVFIKAYQIVEAVQRMYDKTEGDKYRQIFNDCKDCGLLVIDDLGTEKNTEHVDAKIYELIDYRYENLKQTVISSNCTIKDLKEKYDARVATRLAGMCQELNLKGVNKRNVKDYYDLKNK